LSPLLEALQCCLGMALTGELRGPCCLMPFSAQSDLLVTALQGSPTPQ